jgi:uncharacterized protein (TIGR03435 family)
MNCSSRCPSDHSSASEPRERIHDAIDNRLTSKWIRRADCVALILARGSGLSGRYDVAVRFADPRVSSSEALPLAQGLQEQLGLAPYPEKTTVQLFVIDHIEPPAVDR